MPPPSLQSTSHILSNLCSPTPPLPFKSPPPPTLLETIKPWLRWTSPISFLPSTCCPPPHLPLHPIPSILPFPLPPPISACHFSMSLFIPELVLSLPFAVFLFQSLTPPRRSLAPCYQPPTPHTPRLPPFTTLAVIVCEAGPADRPGQGR